MSAPELSLDARGLSKTYRRGSEEIFAVRDVDLQIGKGEFVSFVGPSGSGKTTLINLLGCLDNPSGGELTLAGRKIFSAPGRLSESELTRIRREVFGYVFQNFYLIPTLTVWENVVLPLTFYQKAGSEERAAWLLDLLGIAHRRSHLPDQISGGEMQRVAIARALVNRPEVLMADEPTGNLDTQRSFEIGRVLKELNKDQGLTVVMVTHNLEIAKLADRVVEMRDGQIVSYEVAFKR
jgi:ABC-type lipoprotein export system ATPase subunit